MTAYMYIQIMYSTLQYDNYTCTCTVGTHVLYIVASFTMYMYMYSICMDIVCMVYNADYTVRLLI